jgi:Zn-finger nucleic acid-binding protein
VTGSPKDSTARAAPRAASDQPTLRCGGCGGPLREDEKQCGFCGAAVDASLSRICTECFARNEEDARFCTACGSACTGPLVAYGADPLPCPVCAVDMPARMIGSFATNECPRCNGLFVPNDHFDALVDAAVAARRAKQIEMLVPEPRRNGANPVSQEVAYRRCPICEGHMQRRNFRQRSGVILDVCRDHGTWLDADELEQVAGFILTGGVDEAPSSAARKEQRVSAEFTRILAERRQGVFAPAQPNDPSFLKTALEVLSNLLGP